MKASSFTESFRRTYIQLSDKYIIVRLRHCYNMVRVKLSEPAERHIEEIQCNEW